MAACLASVLLIGRSAVVRAQSVVSSPDSIAPFARPNGALLRAASLAYSLTLTKPNGETLSLGVRKVSVSDAPLGGVPAWLIADNRTGTIVQTSDSVFLARGDLTPLRWNATIGRSTLGASFRHDSMFGAMDSYQGRASFSEGVPGDVILSAGMLERLVEMLPLEQGYRAAATLVTVDGSSPLRVPAFMTVERDQRVQLGTRVVECRTVVVRAGGAEERLYVSKDDARVVRIDQTTREGLLVAVLTVP